jgi:hypothetical protein
MSDIEVDTMILKSKLPGCNAKIRADTCGTAFMRTVKVNVDCEMDITEARTLASVILSSCDWVETNSKNCDICDHEDECEWKES